MSDPSASRRADSPAPDVTSESAPNVRDPRIAACIDTYWRANVAIMAVLLLIWAVVGLGCGVLFADKLNAIRIGGFPLGFWFAQQGSIVVFVVLILVYAVLLNRLDARHHAELVRLRGEAANGDTEEVEGQLE